jgi:hypothetical protein
MARPKFSRIAVYLTLMLGLASNLSSCGFVSTGGASTTCPSKTAQIAVFDTQMRRVCGCAETSGTYFGVGQSLNCTVSAGTTVYFNYVGITITHLITIPGQTMFVTRNASTANQTDGWQFNSTGSFLFSDIYTTIGGTITVL